MEQSRVKLERRERWLWGVAVDRRHERAAVVQCGSFIVDVLHRALRWMLRSQRERLGRCMDPRDRDLFYFGFS